MNKYTAGISSLVLAMSIAAAAAANAQGGFNARGREGGDDARGNGTPTRGCRALPSHDQLKEALTAARALGKAVNGGLDLDMWGTIVDRDGVVCAVAFTGADRGDQWPGSRVVSAQKASTANAFSVPGLSLSTANLYTATQPGGSLFGLQESNPVSTDVAYSGNPARYGQHNDPMVGERIGGVNVFGGGLALYDVNGRILGGLGVSGDTSCADHNIAYRTRNSLELDYVPAGVAALTDPTRRDNIIFDITPQSNGLPPQGQMSGISGVNQPANPGGFGHPSCHLYSTQGNAISRGFSNSLPANRP
jgi:uncharacterized protein GlcG (DUF336 family)